MQPLKGLSVGRLFGIPITLHFTLPLGLFLFGGLRFAPGFWCAAMLLLVAHELGHAAVVRRTGHEVTQIVLHGLGGLCYWRGAASPMARAKIAWGGVLAQLAILVVACSVFMVWHEHRPRWARDVESALVTANFGLLALNLVPIRPLDGAEAWPLIGLFVGRMRGRRRKKAAQVNGVVIDLFDRAKRRGK